MGRPRSQPLSRSLRVLIVDDHPLLREGLAATVRSQPDMAVCGEAESIGDARRLIRSECPDVVILDIQLLDGNSIDFIKELTEQRTTTRVLVVSAFDEKVYAERALRAGAMGYLNKRELQTRVLDAIRAIAAGQKFLSSEMMQVLLSQALNDKQRESRPPELRLSDRELEIFQMIGAGMTTGAIANQLCLSVHTVDTHRENLKHKLGVANSMELTRRAILWCIEHTS